MIPTAIEPVGLLYLQRGEDHEDRSLHRCRQGQGPSHLQGRKGPREGRRRLLCRPQFVSAWLAASRNSSTSVAIASITRSSPSRRRDRKSTRLNSSHVAISYAVFCLKKKNKKQNKSHR